MGEAEHLVIASEDERAHLDQTPAAMASLIAAQGAYARRLRDDGVLRMFGRLRPSSDGARVGAASGATRVEHGPFGPRALAHFYWLRPSTLDAARALASACPVLPGDELEVRPIMKGELDLAVLRRAGPLFACAVLGRAPSEAAWRGVMDRIDAETRGGFPPGAFLGGVRLTAPVRASGERARAEPRAERDGPFLEGKEVIGGLCLLRLPAIEDAITWAAGSRFAVHGTLEVRPLWRT
jgi:hypothetical protein